MDRSWRQRFGVALICVGFVSGILGVLAPGAGADHGGSPAESCNSSVLRGDRDPGLEKVATAAGGDSTVVPGEQVDVVLTWATSDWTSIDKVLDCVFVNGAVVESISFEEKPGHNDGTATHSYLVPAGLPDGAEVCDVGRVSGNPSPTNATDSTHKSNVVCFTVDNPEPAGSVAIVKTPDGGQVAHGDDLSFTITVTAGGDADSTNVTVTDDLPNDFTWTIDSQTGSACSIDGNGDLACDIGTMAPTQTYSVTVTASTDGAECGLVENFAQVESDNDKAGDDGDLMIVRCEPSTGTLVVSKSVVDEVGDGSQEFEFSVTCGGQLVDTFSLGHGESWPEAGDPAGINEFDEGTQCTVTETAVTGWTTTYTVGGGESQGGTVAAATVDDAATAVAFTNTRRSTGGGGPAPQAVTGPLVITKAVAGVPAGTAGIYTFTFAVDCTDNAFDGVTTITGEGTTTFHPAVPQGVTCTVTETGINPLVSGDEWATTVTDSDGAADGTVTITDAAGESVTFTNTRTEVAGVVIDRPEPTAPQPAPRPEPEPQPAPEPEVLPQVEERGAALARTGVETGDFMLFAGIALFLGGLLVGWSRGADRRSAPKAA